MEKPLIVFLSFNRCGPAATNLKALLDNTDDDFDLCIVDNHSTDGIWEYINSIKDDRIISKTQFDKNYGYVYALNYGLSKRKKYQPFVSFDNDILIKDSHWITKVQECSSNFPDLGLIGLFSDYAFNYYFGTLPKLTVNNSSCVYAPSVMGCCNYIIPEIFEIIGYWNEESCGADLEMCPRINLFTPYRTGVICDPLIDFRGAVYCTECVAGSVCKFDSSLQIQECITNYSKVYTHASFGPIALAQADRYIQLMKAGKASYYSASIHDKDSRKNHTYDFEAANKNFMFFANFNPSN